MEIYTLIKEDCNEFLTSVKALWSFTDINAARAALKREIDEAKELWRYNGWIDEAKELYSPDEWSIFKNFDYPFRHTLLTILTSNLVESTDEQ